MSLGNILLPSGEIFPLVPSGDSRYLENQRGAPTPIMGRTAWALVKLSTSDCHSFIDDTASKEFNAIECWAIFSADRCNNRGQAGDGSYPFLKRLDGNDWSGTFTFGNINNEAPDMTTPNTPYWLYVDEILSYSLSKGIMVMLFPAYHGFAASLAEGWGPIKTANGATKMQTYGAWIADRYKNFPNIIWMLGGDYGTGDNSFTAPELAVEQALLAGIQSVSGQSVHFSAEWHAPEIYADQSDATLKAAGTLQGAYDWGTITTQCRRAYANSPTMPAFMLEEPYDEEGPDGTNVNGDALQPCRRYQWWGWIETVAGYMAGNGYIWPFNTSGYGSPWTTHLDTQTTLDNARLNAFLKTIQWWTLVPDGQGSIGTLITAGKGAIDDVNGQTYVAASCNPAGTLFVAYGARNFTSFTVDMTKMSTAARARWFNPTTAAYTLISASIANTGTHTFNNPGDNGSGKADWVLVMDPA